MKAHVHAAVGIVVVLLGVASASGAQNAPTQKRPSAGGTSPCAWGASSIVARFVDDRWVVETPHTSGCKP